MLRLLKTTYFSLPHTFRPLSTHHRDQTNPEINSEHIQYSMLNSMIEAKMNKLPLEKIMEPLVEYKKGNQTILRTSIHSFLFDLCSTKEEIDAVMLDLKNVDYIRAFRLRTVMTWDTKKLEQVCDSIKRIQGIDSLLSVLRIIFHLGISHGLDLIFEYAQNGIDATTLVHHFVSTLKVSQLHNLLGVILKLENYDELVGQLKYKLLHDNELYEFVRGESCWTHLRVMLLELFIAEYRNSEGNDYLDRIDILFDQVKSKLEIKLELSGSDSFAKDALFTKFEIRPLALDLYQACLEKDNIDLAAKAFEIFTYTRYVYLSMKNKDRYFANLLHLQSLARVRVLSKNKIEESISIPLTNFINHTLGSGVKKLGLFPSPILFAGYLHSYMVDLSGPLDKDLSRELYLLLATQKKEQILEHLTEWTQYYKPKDKIPNSIYCNMLYLIIIVAARMSAMLTPQQVNDMLRRLTPYIRKEEEKKSFSKSVDFFDRRLCEIYENCHTEVPMEIHNSVLYAFSRAKDFPNMRVKFNHLVEEEILGNEETFGLLISTAALRNLEDECEFLLTKVWDQIKKFYDNKTIPIHLIEGIINCCMKTQNYQKAISFVGYTLKADSEISAKVIDGMFDSFHKAGKNNEMNDLKKTLKSTKNLDYEEIIEKHSI